MKKNTGWYTSYLGFSICILIPVGYYYLFPITPSFKKQHISIVTAHNEHIKAFTIPFLQRKFKEKYGEDLHVEWVKQGGQNTNVKLLLANFAKTGGATSKHDILWGGGESIFDMLHEKGYLVPIELDPAYKKAIPAKLAGVRIFNLPDQPTWIATFLSTLGLLCNKKKAATFGIPLPKNWVALADPVYFNQIMLGDPTQSSSVWAFYAIILLNHDWQHAWSLFVGMAANSLSFADNSSGLIKSILEGRTLFAPCLAFSAKNLMIEIGKEDLMLTVPPPEQNFINADPIAIMKGAPHNAIAQFCVNQLLSPEFQKAFAREKGTPGACPNYTFGRIAVHPEAYLQTSTQDNIVAAINPFTIKTNTRLDLQVATRKYSLVSTLFKVVLIQNHAMLKKAWQLIISNGMQQEDLQTLFELPLKEEEVNMLISSGKWGDPLLREKQKNIWNRLARARYKKIIQKYS